MSRLLAIIILCAVRLTAGAQQILVDPYHQPGNASTLYDAEMSGKPDLWKHDPQENWVQFTAKIVSDIHSFTVIETDGKKLTLRQLNAKGVVFDEIYLTK